MAISALLIIPTFILWGVGGAIRSEKKAPKFAGTIFDKNITFEDFHKSFNIIRGSLKRNYPGQLPDEFIVQMAWNRLILLEEARRKKITVTKDEIAKEISQIPQFQTNGRFDIALYKDMLQDRAQTFEEEVKNDLLIEKLKTMVWKDVRLSDEEIKTEYKNQNEKAKISYILVATDTLKTQGTTTDEDIKSYFDAHKEDFKKPLEVNLEYIEITDELIDKVDEAVSKNTNDLSKLSRQFNIPIKETGFFGRQDSIPGIGFVFDVYKEAFQLQAGKMSKPIQMPQGYCIIRVKETRKDYIPSLPDVKERVKETLVKQKAKEEASILTKKYHDSIKESLNTNKDAKLEDICKTLSVELKQTEPFTRKDYIPNLGPASVLKETVFSIKTGDISEPTEVETGFCIFRLDEIIQIDEEKFRQEKDKFSEDLLKTRQDEYFNNWFEVLRTEAGLKSEI